MLLGAFFYGYMITSLPSGMLAENLGGKPVAGYSCIIAGILTALTPLAASWNKWAVWILRFGVGFLQLVSHHLAPSFGMIVVCLWFWLLGRFDKTKELVVGIMLIILAFYGKDPYVCVAIMTISLGFNGAATASNLQNSQDLAPNYAGTLYGIINCVGTTPGIFSPMIVAAFTKKNVMFKFGILFAVPYNQTHNNQFHTIVVFDCRGTEPVEFAPQAGWLVQSADGGQKFEDVDLSENEWVDYDEKNKQSVGVYEFASKFIKLKK
ncbi:UPF0587 protein CG4646 [Eumeta japonica]|uniref:UPF0587 protein CG4646 n=1 Tax=Eumeta variegata TaxID=151549 RepID=A0A4C1SLT6_EUMVA|nr:UPF0587 protein CG4646 [Eumeta japonica]